MSEKPQKSKSKSKKPQEKKSKKPVKSKGSTKSKPTASKNATKSSTSLSGRPKEGASASSTSTPAASSSGSASATALAPSTPAPAPSTTAPAPTPSTPTPAPSTTAPAPEPSTPAPAATTPAAPEPATPAPSATTPAATAPVAAAAGCETLRFGKDNKAPEAATSLNVTGPPRIAIKVNGQYSVTGPLVILQEGSTSQMKTLKAGEVTPKVDSAVPPAATDPGTKASTTSTVDAETKKKRKEVKTKKNAFAIGRLVLMLSDVQPDQLLPEDCLELRQIYGILIKVIHDFQ